MLRFGGEFMRRFVLPGLVIFAAFSVALVRADRYDRDASALSRLMHWSAGQTLAEIGAGEGQLSFAAAKAVGPEGHVYTTELDEQKLTDLRAAVRKRKLSNITVVEAGAIDTNLPEACCDGIFLRHVYHHFSKPDATNASILRALKPGGFLAVIDFPPRRFSTTSAPVNGALSSPGGHGIQKNIVEKELVAAGFEILPQDSDWPEHDDYCVLARKPLSH
jgi:ubiquinone/menaquinone biosynthesis C-methylase UbiE